MPRYLPIKKPDGSWIDKPGLYVLARMAYEDETDDPLVAQLHDVMSRASNTSPELNALERDISDRHLMRELRFRVFAGNTILELFRIGETTRKAPTLGQAIRLAAHNQKQFEGKPTSVESFERNVRLAVQKFRNTLHLQGAMVFQNPPISEIETSEEALVRFLKVALRLEQFIDERLTESSFTWDPWRVPLEHDAAVNLQIGALSEQELKIGKVRT
jgi:hypothetical protein